MTGILFEYEDFDFSNIEEELKVVEQCQKLLQQFYIWLQKQDKTPEKASELCYRTDYYLRDYLLDFMQSNLLRYQSGQIRYFGGNWYITHSPEPDIEILNCHLEAITCFYLYLQSLNLISLAELDQIEKETSETEYYRQRIRSFFTILGEGFDVWDMECPLMKE